MSVLVFTLILFCGALLAGVLGALTGLGGGIVIIPLLTLGLGVDMHYAIGASLISVIATSSGAAPAFLKMGYTNVRVGIFLQIATTVGAVLGAVLAVYTPVNALAIMLGIILLYSAYSSLTPKKNLSTNTIGDKWATKLQLNSSFSSAQGEEHYKVHNVMGGFTMMTFAGIVSGMLGIGSGALKVLAMDKLMRLPFKVSTATSNFMIGVTAVASTVVYFQRGYIVASIVAPVMLGVLIGSMFGASYLSKMNTTMLRKIFAAVVTLVAIQMMIKGFTKGF